MISLLLAVLAGLAVGCATTRSTVRSMKEPENRFAAGTMIALPGFIAGAAVIRG